MKRTENDLLNVKASPQTYLIFALNLGGKKEDYDFFIDYNKKCLNNDNNIQWKPSHIDTIPLPKKEASTNDRQKKEEEYVSPLRYSTHFEYVNQIFHAIEGTIYKETKSQDCFVLELRNKEQYKTIIEDKKHRDKNNAYFVNPYKDNGETTEFSFQCNKGDIDSIRLFLNPSAKTGILILPIRPYKISIYEYQNFIAYIRKTDNKCIKEKNKAEEPWSLNDRVDKLLKDFNGHYKRVNLEYAHHLTFIHVDKKDIGNEYDSILQGITRCKNRNQVNGLLPCKVLRLSNNVLIGSSQEGTTIITAENIKETQEQKENQYIQYVTEQTERICLYFILILQRYILLRVISDLCNYETPQFYQNHVSIKQRMNYWHKNFVSWSKKILSYFKIIKISEEEFEANSLKKLRAGFGVVCWTKVKNSFTSISDIFEVNEYYRLCIESLEINNLYNEIDRKMRNLDSYLTQKSDESKEHADWHLSIILAAFAVMSTGNDGIQLIDRITNKGQNSLSWLYIVGLILAIFFVAYLIFTIIKTRR